MPEGPHLEGFLQLLEEGMSTQEVSRALTKMVAEGIKSWKTYLKAVSTACSTWHLVGFWRRISRFYAWVTEEIINTGSSPGFVHWIYLDKKWICNCNLRKTHSYCLLQKKKKSLILTFGSNFLLGLLQNVPSISKTRRNLKFRGAKILQATFCSLFFQATPE